MKIIPFPSSCMICLLEDFSGVHGVMAIIIGNGQGNLSSIPGQGCLHFTLC